MKKYVLPLLLLGGCLCLSGCKAQRSYEPAPSVAAPSVTALEQPFRQMSGNPDGMALYSACTFSYGGQDWAVESYVPAELMLDGELMLDDSCHFLLRAVCLSKQALPEGAVLLDERVQLGVPAADVWVDGQEQLHVTLRDVRTACYQVTDYVYRPERHAMVGSTVLDASGINYVGTTQR